MPTVPDMKMPLTPDQARIASLEAQLAERDAMLATARAEAIEECAKVAEGTKAYDDHLQKSCGCPTTGEYIAQALRALTDERTIDD